MGWRAGSEAWSDDLREETNCCSSSDSNSEGAIENLVLEEERDIGAVPTEVVFLARVLLETVADLEEMGRLGKGRTAVLCVTLVDISELS